MEFAVLCHSIIKDESASVHRAGCKDIEREARQHASSVHSVTGTVDDAVASWLDGEMEEMGYSEADVKVHNCCKGRKPKAAQPKSEPKEHRIRWYVKSGDEFIPKTKTMRGQWGHDAKCSCGWESRTGGATAAAVQREVKSHKRHPEG